MVSVLPRTPDARLGDLQQQQQTSSDHNQQHAHDYQTARNLHNAILFSHSMIGYLPTSQMSSAKHVIHVFNTWFLDIWLHANSLCPSAHRRGHASATSAPLPGCARSGRSLHGANRLPPKVRAGQQRNRMRPTACPPKSGQASKRNRMRPTACPPKSGQASQGAG